MNRLRIAITVSLFLLPLGRSLAAQAPAPQQDQTQFQGEIEVREVGIVVEPPDGKALGSLRPEDILVFEDGAPRTAVKAEPLRPGSGASPWSVVLYFDRSLAQPQTIHDAALVLSRQARDLTDLGPVEIVTAGPEPKVELAATRDARSLSAILGGIAAQSRKEARPIRKETPRTAPDPALLRRQLDRLTTFLSGRPDTGARALFLIADSFVPPPGEAAFLTADDAGAPVPPGSLAAALRESSRVLAAYGWVTFAGPLRDSTAERERRQMGDMERIRVQAGGSKHSSGTPPVIQMPPPDRGARGDERVADVFSRPDSAAWMALSQPTSGTVLGVEAQLASLIDSLARRWRVWYRAPESRDGKLRRVEVRLPAAGEPLRSPRWVRASTPEGLAAAHARLLAGAPEVAGGLPASAGDLLLDARLKAGTLTVLVAPTGTADRGPVRVSVAFDNASEVQHFVFPDVILREGWEQSLKISSPSGARRAGVVIEGLAHGRWGGRAVGM